jgi:hypothetical protein
LAIAVLFACVPVPAWAQDVPPTVAAEALPPAEPQPPIPVADAEPPPPLLDTRLVGFLDTRLTYTGVEVDRLLPADDVPAIADLSEGNLQLRLRWGDFGLAYADWSLVWQKGAVFRGADKNGAEVALADHDVPALRNAAVVSELYGTWNLAEHFNVTLGKKRVVWGPGFASNPTDLLNPPKDPTDPAMQRAGSWLLRLEAPFETWTASAVVAAKVTQQYAGLPSGLAWHTDAQHTADKTLDAEPHFAAAVRGYLLWNDSDINVFGYLTHLYNDAFRYKPRVGASFSRVLFDALEVHVEGLVQQGSAKPFADPMCVADLGALVGCVGQGKAPIGFSRLDGDQIHTRTIVGGRWMFANQAALSLEYLIQTDGYDRQEFEAFAKLAAVRREAVHMGLPVPPGLGPSAPTGDPGSPQKFAFEPMRRHYAFLTYMQPQIRDDFTVTAVALLGLADLSGQVTASVAWSVREWLTVTLQGFAGLPGLDSLGAGTAAGRISEFELMPAVWRGIASARVFF